MLENPDGSMDRSIDRWINKPRGWKRVYSHSPILLSPLPDMHVGVMYTKDPGKGGRERIRGCAHILSRIIYRHGVQALDLI